MNQKSVYSKIYVDSIIVSFFICCLIVLWCLQTSEQFQHWFLIPVTLSGILIGIDTVNWFRGRLGIFDPVGIIGVLGFHFFFLAPILHVNWDSWLEPWFSYPPDWRPWLGGMAILNLLGLLVYGFCRNLVPKKPKKQSGQTLWLIDHKRFVRMISFAMMLSAVLQIMVYQKFGGIMSYIASVSDSEELTKFEGMGVMFLFSESFPILAMMSFAVYAQRHKRLQTWPVLIVVLLLFLILQMFFGGLRGSRSNTLWALFWAAGMIHFLIRPITKKEIAIGLVFIFLFMYLYGFYKSGGLDGVKTALEAQETRTELENKSGRTWQSLVLGDLGRSDVHAYMLYKLMLPDSDYKYAWGRTYIAATTSLLPGGILPEKPPQVSQEGTELLFGRGSYKPGEWVASKVYGITGEAMLNFGPFVVPLAFIPFGILVGWIQRCLFTWKSSDSRLLLLPMLVNLCFIVLVSDLYLDIFFLMKNSGFPTLVILLSSRKNSLHDSFSHSGIYSNTQ
ncbi:MAG: hypothetical protein DSM106950_12220 [Stigonema ocellatum SAG 48.90 = DSM 106950]|nr:hypothetical protein [Stigonema ocellatum SAG 48.90 = DSM 106950]